METPFIFGRLAQGDFFTNREEETHQLINNFKTGSHTILISPRRWGKSSLVKKAAEATAAKERNIRFCSIDLFNARNEQQFYQMLAKEVLRSASGKWDDLMENARTYLGRLIPNLTFSPDRAGEFELALNWKEVSKSPDEILDLAEKLAAKKRIKLIVCIDEFQNIKTFDNPLAFQKKLRSHWQKHQRVSYCLYGSKRNMMMEVFSSPEMPFYKFGNLMFLEKIKEIDWVPFLIKRFSKTKKKINKEQASLIVKMVECHPYYVQQLAQQVWLRTNKNCSEKIVEEASDGLILQLSLLFQNITDSLTEGQVNFLRAMLDEVTQFSSAKMLHEYQLGTSANVLRIKDALVNKEVIDLTETKMEFLDPCYKLWLKNYYFKP